MKQSTFFRFSAPSIIMMVLLMVVPLLMAIWLGLNFMTFNNINDPQFIGLQNYIEVLQDSRFWQSFGFTALYAVVVVPAQLLIGFTMALLLDQVSRFTRGIYLGDYPVYLAPYLNLYFAWVFNVYSPAYCDWRITDYCVWVR